MTKITISISLSEELVKEIDSFRKLIPRSRFIELTINKYLQEEKNGLC